MQPANTYKYSGYAIGITMLLAAVICFVITWQHGTALPNLIGGDARFYYYYLQSTFIDPALVTYDWLHDPNVPPFTHHPVGLSILLSPFFFVALAAAHLFHYPLTGLSAPFQLGFSVAALVYCTIAFIYLRKLLRLNHIPDKVIALIIPLLFFGTNLYHYTLTESGMSHVYSFCLITLFLYHSCRFVNEQHTINLLYAALFFGLVLLVRPNNGLVIFSIFFWFKSWEHCVQFFKNLLRNKTLYYSAVVILAMVAIQFTTWHFKEHTLFANRYVAYGFYWTRPELWQMLFGFEAGFFIYTPLCLLFFVGLIYTYQPQRFLFYAVAAFFALLFYFFACYSAYTYYDGLGIRVLVDYYAIFALLGAKLFTALSSQPWAYRGVALLALMLVFINQVYCIQERKNIIARSGMNFNKWKYVFLKTSDDYVECLGGINDLEPYSKHPAPLRQTREMQLPQPFNYDKTDYGVVLRFDSLNFTSNRVLLKMNIGRREKFANASKDVLVCAMLEDKATHQQKQYLQFKLNETPAKDCCDDVQYAYAAKMEADFKAGDQLSVYLWNRGLQAFEVDKFKVEIYDYNYNY